MMASHDDGVACIDEQEHEENLGDVSRVIVVEVDDEVLGQDVPRLWTENLLVLIDKVLETGRPALFELRRPYATLRACLTFRSHQWRYHLDQARWVYEHSPMRDLEGALAEDPYPQKIYVNEDIGDDFGKGTIDSPVRTQEEAERRARMTKPGELFILEWGLWGARRLSTGHRRPMKESCPTITGSE